MNTKQLLLASMLMFVSLNTVKSLTMEQLEKMARGMRNTCVQKIGVSEALVDGLRRGEFPEDNDLKCYTNCIMKIMRSFKNGAIDFNSMLKQIDMSVPADIAPRMKDVVKTCSELEFTGDPCTMSYEYVKCVQRTDPDIFFFP